MKHIYVYIPLVIICIVIVYVFCWYFKSPATTVILVRHADRTGTIDQLNTLGQERAVELARVLEESNILAIYSSNANRTQQTAAPLAAQLGLNTIIYDASDLPALVDLIDSDYSGDVVLVVGHSDTVPQTIAELGVGSSGIVIGSADFDNLYSVTYSNCIISKLIKMEYGATTP